MPFFQLSKYIHSRPICCASFPTKRPGEGYFLTRFFSSISLKVHLCPPNQMGSTITFFGWNFPTQHHAHNQKAHLWEYSHTTIFFEELANTPNPQPQKMALSWRFRSVPPKCRGQTPLQIKSPLPGLVHGVWDGNQPGLQKATAAATQAETQPH